LRERAAEWLAASDSGDDRMRSASRD